MAHMQCWSAFVLTRLTIPEDLPAVMCSVGGRRALLTVARGCRVCHVAYPHLRPQPCLHAGPVTEVQTLICETLPQLTDKSPGVVESIQNEGAPVSEDSLRREPLDTGTESHLIAGNGYVLLMGIGMLSRRVYRLTIQR